MNRIILFFSVSLYLVSCKNDDKLSQNPFLSSVAVDFVIDLDLPEYDLLNYASNTYVDRTEGRGVQGIIIHNINGELYTAFELSDPNTLPNNSCSVLKIDGPEAYSKCDEERRYNLINGQKIKGIGDYSLISYYIKKNGKNLIITNNPI